MSVTKHITQGGQVFSYMLNMFMQVNRRIAFWLCNLFILLVPFIFWVRVPWQEICNGALYWWLSVTAKGEHALFRVPPVYAVRYEGQILHFTSGAILKDPYMTYAGQLVVQELGIAVLLASLVVLVACYGVYYWLKRLGENQAQDVQTGGRTLTENVKSVTRMLHQSGNASTLHIDQLSLVRDSELKNLLLHGTPGSGKSNALNKLLRQLRARGDMVVVYDKGCSLVKRHYNPTTDSLLNPLDRRCEYWDLWLECQSTPDYDSIANTLIPQGTREDPFWTGAARTIFTAVSARLKNDPQRTYNRLLRTLLAINLEALREYVVGTEASNLMEEKVEKTAISIRGVLTNYVKALRYMQGIEHTGRPRFAIREWMTRVNEPGQPRGWLWITSNARQHTSLKPLISMWLAQAANCLLEMGENSNRRVWFIFDELTSLHKLPELPLVLSEARKFGGCFVLGFQNKPQLDFTYGKDFADAMMDLLNTRFFFRSPDEGVASYVMRQLGQRRARIFSEQCSYGADTVRDGVSFSKQEEDRYLVNYSDIQSLPDLSCFVTLPGQYPVVRMNMRFEDLDIIAPEFLPRELNDSLDQEIDAEIRSRDLENERVMRLLASLEDGPGEAVSAGCTFGADQLASADDAVGKQAVPEGMIVEKMTGERGMRPEQERTGLPAEHALRASEQHLLTHSRSDNTPPGDDW
ncbi:type IV conjugative transfer system coupling protein TraD (plasmid) [Enterobacter asburiae]|uniref:type IV conjugative transfer system coupling protein TraD n=1 Tax=Enterobacter asburiae TaxID=61645 RepID=UPI002932E904|nr:type IV conjugative transfer system coupling protein TraD [Enterobacter asburiae]EMA4739511.1 type IV conjugative transfer system coupling protein TraD [Enterobacter asburiae]